MAERVRMREITNEEGNRLLRIVRRSSGSVVTWLRAQSGRVRVVRSCASCRRRSRGPVSDFRPSAGDYGRLTRRGGPTRTSGDPTLAGGPLVFVREAFRSLGEPNRLTSEHDSDEW